MIPSPGDRYSRQLLFHEIGEAGQRLIGSSRMAVVGLGALGCQEAALLARAGVGFLRLIDRDFVEVTNLQRQILFTEEDAALALPKAVAAANHLAAANSEIEIRAEVRDLTASTVERLLTGVDIIVDGSDNFEVRYLVNDFAVRAGLPWIYAAGVGATGLILPVIPEITACLRCLFEDPPPAGSAATCDTAGVFGPLTSTVGAVAAMEALKIAAGRREAVRRGLLQIDLWSNEFRAIAVDRPREECPCCGRRRFPFLEVREAGATLELCGREAVQISPPPGTTFDLDAVRPRIARAVEVDDNGFLLRFRAEGLQVTLFRDGRAILKGTTDPARARGVYARLVGN
ncbi:MAG: ThiF family adenylyltransferase [Planctomycetota bacterium]